MNFIQYERKDRVATITLNRPDKRNALNHEVVSELMQAFSSAESDDQVRAVILRANGEAFCAGADLAYLQDLQRYTYAENLEDSKRLKDLFYKIYTFNKIVVAQVEGDALAGGAGLAACCDFIFSTPEARFGYTEVKIGFIPAIVMVFLLRKIGGGKAKELLLTGNLFSAEWAQSIGLINYVADQSKIADEVLAFVTRLIETNSSTAMSMTKEMMIHVQSLSLEDGLSYACEMNAKARGSADCKAGIEAFLNKTKIKW